jgi:hypothetical protein
VDAITRSDNDVWLTDKELCARWRCSPMKLWRMRASGKLRKGTKIGGTGQNLNCLSEVKAIEGRHVP